MTVKEGHLAVTATAPVSGPPCPPLFTFSGALNDKDMAAGCGDEIRWNKTANGWPDYNTMMIWGHMMVEHKKKQGLAKMLIFCDNASVHMNLELNHLFSQHNIRLFGLIPSSTHATQPLDLVFFGLIKPMMDAIAKKSKQTLRYSNICIIWLQAQNELVRRFKLKNKSMLTDGFHASGIYPFNPSKSLAKTAYSSIVYKPAAEDIAAAAEVGKLAGKMEKDEILKSCENALQEGVTGASSIFQPLAERSILEQQLLGANKKRKVELPLDPQARAVHFLATHSYTSESFALAEKAKAAAAVAAATQKAAKEAAAVAKKIQTAADEAARKAARAAEAEARRVQKELVNVAKEERKAEREAARLAKQAEAPKAVGLPKAAVKIPRAAEPIPEYGPPKKIKKIKLNI